MRPRSFIKGNGVAQWAYAIARNGYISQCRSTRAKLARASDGTDALEGVAGSEGTGEQQAVARQTEQIVERALLDMTPAQREAFVLLRCNACACRRPQSGWGSPEAQ